MFRPLRGYHAMALKRICIGFCGNESSELPVRTTARYQLAVEPLRQHCTRVPWIVDRFEGSW